MKNIVQILSILALFVLGGFNHIGTKRYKVRKVVIDAGHGGHDPGALGTYSKEKDLALKIALRLGRLIERNMKDVKVVYTRKKDEFVTLHERAQVANKNNADAFISIHCNATPNKKNTHGTETYTMGLHTSKDNLAVAKKENSVILLEKDYQKNYQGFNPKSPEAHIMLELYQSAYNENSLMLAQKIEHQFKSQIGRHSRGVKQAGFLVLWKTTAPSVLVESGFITHPKEEKYLNTSAGQHKIASGIFRAFRDYKMQLESAS